MNTTLQILGDPTQAAFPSRNLFFKEFSRLEPVLCERLPIAIAAVRSRGETHLRVWSYSCGQGHETYAIAMIVDKVLRDTAADMTFEVVGTDSEPVAIMAATRGLYFWDEVKGIPATYLSAHWIRGTGGNSGFVQAQDSLKQRCFFKLFNSTEKQKFDLIVTKQNLNGSLNSYLEPRGQVIDGTGFQTSRAFSKPIRMLCVDDSPVVLGFLKKILTPENGFEVVATATNGLEATEMLRAHRVDAMTLDIHMPEQTGLEYLRKNFGPEHPPVVMLTSVAREDMESGLACLETGVKDYIEKSQASGLISQADEIRLKVRCAYQEKQIEQITERLDAMNGLIELSKSFARPELILKPEDKLRVIIAHVGELDRLKEVLKKIKSPQPGTLVLFHGKLYGDKDSTREFFEDLKSSCVSRPQLWNGSSPITQGIYFASFEKSIESAKRNFHGRRIASMVLGDVDQAVSTKIAAWVAWTRTRLFIEDDGNHSAAHQALRALASEALPATGFIHQADDYLRQMN